MSDVVLSLKEISKSFGTVRALDRVSLEFREREVVGLIGENGAGKSTLLKILCGVTQPDTGSLELRGKPVTLRSVASAADQGIGMVFQEQSLLPNVTVAENILIGHEGAAVKSGLYRWKRLNELARVQLAKLGVDIDPAVDAETLSFGQRQLVELAKVLAIEERTHHPPIILLDEPTSVLHAEELETVLSHIENLRTRATVVFVSHRLDEVLRVSDRVYVMPNAQCGAERDPRQCDTGELQRLMLGHELETAYVRRERKAPLASGPVRLRARDLSVAGSFEGVTFDLQAGEILGIAGVEGSGREVLCRSLFGAEATTGGEIEVDGRRVRFADSAEAVRAGLGYVPSERRTEGIVGGLSVRKNITLAYLGGVMRGPVVDIPAERRLAQSWVERLHIRTPSIETQASRLSGGNQQKVVLAKWLVDRRLKILILDHPMRGLDVGAKAEIFTLIKKLAEDGVGIVLIADTLDELLALSDKVLVMRDGRVSGSHDLGTAIPTQLQLLEQMV